MLKLIPTLLCVFALLSACSSLPKTNQPNNLQLARAQQGLNVYGQAIAKPLNLISNDDVLYLSEDAKQALFKHVNPKWRSSHKYRALIDWLKSGEQTLMLYRNDYTRTAMQTIRHGVGNCLSLTAVFYAYAKALNLNVQFNHVKVPPRWQISESQKTFLRYDHVNAKVILPFHGVEYVDFSAENFHPTMPMRTLSENAFKALFFANRSIEYMVQDDVLLAFRHGLAAVNLDPHNSNLWNNLATLYRRLGHHDLAEISYQQAIHLSPSNIVAWSNLAFLYRDKGDIEKAQEIDELANPYRNNNPYYLAWKAQNAKKKGQLSLAMRSLKRAIQLKSDVHFFYHQLASIQVENQDLAAALRNYRKALRLTDQPAYREHYIEQQAELEKRLQQSTSHRL
ncbi:tetratricopeptide repeat protein [Bermanella marisrubri]|uniref:TPR domain protein n=1 Tax=Bermanella marisrubri TaxID=207949 RepID=Q1N211_9GAMM|nr:tetratricopeptide repeat protein [Bermanella marisrubri]EAT12353.1 TPR domain protein [Bermanella marisrubri]QIZ85436.1 tetratricopeptide repeat protein [Bermanella marisrubri]